MHVKSAFLQARGFNRLICVRPPCEAVPHGILWLLDSAAYGLTDSGTFWYLTSSYYLINKHCLIWSKYDHTLYYSKGENGDLGFVLAVLVDDYLYEVITVRIELFENF